MTLSISETDLNQKQNFKAVRVYFIITLFCVIFGIIYEHFSHGVYSVFMIFMFLIPLLGGILPFAVLALMKIVPYPDRVSFNLWNSGVATLTVGSCVKGVLDIYGTTSDFVIFYPTVGFLFILAGIVTFACRLKRL